MLTTSHRAPLRSWFSPTLAPELFKSLISHHWLYPCPSSLLVSMLMQQSSIWWMKNWGICRAAGFSVSIHHLQPSCLLSQWALILSVQLLSLKAGWQCKRRDWEISSKSQREEGEIGRYAVMSLYSLLGICQCVGVCECGGTFVWMWTVYMRVCVSVCLCVCVCMCPMVAWLWGRPIIFQRMVFYQR